MNFDLFQEHRTPLHYAAMRGKRKIVEVLVLFGADVTLLTKVKLVRTKGQCLIASERTPLGFTCSLTVLYVFDVLMKAYTTTPGACKLAYTSPHAHLSFTGSSVSPNIRTPLLQPILLVPVYRRLSTEACSSGANNYIDTSPLRPVLLLPIYRHLSIVGCSSVSDIQTPLHYGLFFC